MKELYKYNSTVHVLRMSELHARGVREAAVVIHALDVAKENVSCYKMARR